MAYEEPGTAAQAFDMETQRANAVPQAQYDEAQQNVRKRGMLEQMIRFRNKPVGRAIMGVLSGGISETPIAKPMEKMVWTKSGTIDKDKYNKMVNGNPIFTVDPSQAAGAPGSPGYAPAGGGNPLFDKYKNFAR